MGYEAEGFGRRLGAAMALVDLDPKVLAFELGVSNQTIYNMLNGASPEPKKERLVALELLVRQPREWLLEGEGPPPMPRDEDADPLARYALRLARLEEAEVDQERALRDLRKQLERIALRLEAVLEAREP